MDLRRYLENAAIVLIFLLIFGHVSFLIGGDINSVPRISVDQVKQLLGKPGTVIIDVRRSRNWWRTGQKILTAVREEPSKVDQWARKYTKDQTLIFY
jgi:hypothetical protein